MLKRIIILFILIILCNNSINTNEIPFKYVSVHSPIGIPENYSNVSDFYIFRSQYIVNYNVKLKATNFVIYNLNKDWYGDTPRYTGAFLSDSTINNETNTNIIHNDYTNSGYDRGHLVRSEERTKSKLDNKSTFYLSNVIPQTNDVNAGPWLRLEDYCEDLCKKYNKNLYIVAGGIYNNNSKLLNKKITIADTLFKIILITDYKVTKKSKINIYNTSIIAIKIPNIKGIKKHKWYDYICTVDQIEQSIRYDVFNLLADKLENQLESTLFMYSNIK